MIDTKENILNDDRIGRLLLKLSLPAFVGMFVMTLYNVVDTVFIGHFVGPKGIAALAIVFPVQMLAMGIGHMAGMGGASLISRQIGAGNHSGAERSLGNAITCTLILSALIMLLGLCWLDECLAQLGASEAILPYAREYLRIILVGLFFQTFGMLLNTLIRAEGNAKVPMLGMILGACLNVALDAFFIIVLKLGIKGAAYATLIGEGVSVLFFLRYYFFGNSFLHFHLACFRIHWPTMRQIFSIGISAFGMSVATSLSAIFVNRICLFYGGDLAVSAFGIINRLIMFALMPGIVIGMGLQPVIGYNYGARRFDRILRAIFISFTAATIFCFAAFILMVFTPEPFIRIFTTDTSLIDLTAYGIRRLFSGMFLVGAVIVGSTVFQALGKAVQSFITSVTRATLFLIPLVFILPRFLKLDGIWWSFPLTDLLTFLLTMSLLLPQLRQLRRQRRLMEPPAETGPS